ncbi:hypothetical protein LINPERPRIM_LOCUS29444 [Linum perenne]
MLEFVLKLTYPNPYFVNTLLMIEFSIWSM